MWRPCLGLIAAVVDEAGLALGQLDAIAATITPGLAGALMVASVTGRTLAALHQSSVPWNSPFGGPSGLGDAWREAPPQAPYLVLLVSGGHTELILVADGGGDEASRPEP